MTTKLPIIFLLVLLNACSYGSNEKTTNKDRAAPATDIQKVTEPLTSELIQKMLDLPRWQWVYHPEFDGRLPVKVLKNHLVDDRLALTKFNENVQFVSKMELEAQKSIGYVEIKEMKFRGDTVHFIMEYPIEGAFARGQFLKENGEWAVDKYTVGEY